MESLYDVADEKTIIILTNVTYTYVSIDLMNNG